MMVEKKLKGTWKDWARFRRLVPLVTIATAITVAVMAALGKATPEIVQGATIGILSLLAVDTLVERIGIVEKIEDSISSLGTAASLLRDRSELPSLRDLAGSGSEIAACGVTLVSIVGPSHDFLAARLAEGARIRLLLLDPNSAAYRAWHEAQRIATPEDTKITLRTLEPLVTAWKNIEVRLSPWHLPVSLVMVDSKQDAGRMIVEFAFTAISLPMRPHINLTRRREPQWFSFFDERFEYLWNKSSAWKPADFNPGAEHGAAPAG
jgi:hypothetical protein